MSTQRPGISGRQGTPMFSIFLWQRGRHRQYATTAIALSTGKLSLIQMKGIFEQSSVSFLFQQT